MTTVGVGLKGGRCCHEQFMLCQGASRMGNIDANQPFLFITALWTQKLPGYLTGVFPPSVIEVSLSLQGTLCG